MSLARFIVANILCNFGQVNKNANADSRDINAR